MAEVQARLQALSEDYQKLQQGMSQHHHRADAAINTVQQSFKVLQRRVKSSRARSRRTWVCKKCVSPMLDATPIATPLILNQEFDRLGEGETIYKITGPVLLKQDKFEAEGTVKGRLDFISSEM